MPRHPPCALSYLTVFPFQKNSWRLHNAGLAWSCLFRCRYPVFKEPGFILREGILSKWNENNCAHSGPVVRRSIHESKLRRKEVIHPHLPVGIPCYDFTPIICPTFGGWLPKGYLTDFGCCKLSWCDGRCVQGPGTYSPWHADPRLLAIPASCRRVAACNPN